MTLRRVVVGVLVSGMGVVGAGMHAPSAGAVSQTALVLARGTTTVSFDAVTQRDEGTYNSRGQLGNGRYHFDLHVSSCDTRTGSQAVQGYVALYRSDGATMRGTLHGTEGCFTLHDMGAHFAVWLKTGERDLAGAHLNFDGTLSNFAINPGGETATESLTATGLLTTTARVGWWSLGSTGSVYTFGGVPYRGNAPTVGSVATRLEPTPSGNGYWIVNDAGQVYALGDAHWFGNADRRTWAGATLETVVGIASTASGNGYWLFTNKGRVVPFGDAPRLGGAYPGGLAAHIVAAVATPSHHGYYLVGSDGGVFSYGDAKFHGSTGALALNSPIVGMAESPTGNGYWLVAADGGVFSFGVPFSGSLGDRAVAAPIVGVSAYGDAYVLVDIDGDAFNFSGQPFFGWSATNALTPPPMAGISAVG